MLNNAQKEKINRFLNMYGQDQMVYISAVQRYVSAGWDDIETALDKRCETTQDIKEIYLLRCPICSHMLHGIYNSNAINTETEVNCTECDSIFIPTKYDYIKCYQKK